MNNSKLSIRNIKESDAPMLRYLAQNCPPLDVHTHYTYWVISKFFSEGSFMLLNEGKEVGFITSIITEDCIFIWQIGILPDYRLKHCSHLLIDAVKCFAQRKNKNLKVSIAEENKVSYKSFLGYCKNNNILFKENGELSINDIIDKEFFEKEKIYEMIFLRG